MVQNQSSGKKGQDTSYTYTLQQPFHGQTQYAPPTAAFGPINQYHETSSDYSDGEDDEEEETESSAIEDDYGEDDDSQESSFTDYNPSDKVVHHYFNGNPNNGQVPPYGQHGYMPENGNYYAG